MCLDLSRGRGNDPTLSVEIRFAQLTIPIAADIRQFRQMRSTHRNDDMCFLGGAPAANNCHSLGENMAKDHSSVVSGTIATVVGGLILAGLTWLFGFFPVVWSTIAAGLIWVWSLLTYLVTLSVGMLLAAACALFLAGHYLCSKRSVSIQRVTEGIRPQPVPDDEPIQISQFEGDVVRVLVGGDGSWIALHEIAGHLSTSNLMVEQALEKLYINDMILKANHYMVGTTFRLSSKGRDYAIDQGYVPGQAGCP